MADTTDFDYEVKRSVTLASPKGGLEFSFPKHRINVLLLENIHASAVKAFEDEGFHVVTKAKISQEELAEAIKTVHIVGVRSKTKLTKEVLANAKKLLAIGCFCIGTDQTDLDFAADQGICVFNAPFSNTRSVAEIVMSHIISLARQVVDDNAAMHKGIWRKSADGKYEVRGKILGIVGYGHVGSQLSILAEAFGMKVIYYDVLPKLPLGNAVSMSSMQDVLKNADFVTIHVPLAPTTIDLITAKEIALMKKGSYFINYARGQCVIIPALAEALRSGKLAGAAIDVYPVEPASGEPFESELIGLPNTILTPHIGGSTEEAQEAIGKEVALKLLNFINRGCTLAAVNFPEVDLPVLEGKHRILNVHRNVPGVLKEINNVLSDYNISSQIVSTKGSIGFLIVILDSDASAEAKKHIAELKTSIKTRVLY